MHDTSESNEGMQKTGGGEEEMFRDPVKHLAKEMREMSADELREHSRKETAKITAIVSGALEGYSEQAAPRAVGDAARKATETVKEAARGVREEARKTDPSGFRGGP